MLKCCDLNSSMVQENGFIYCNHTANRRIFISTDLLINEANNGNCLETFEDHLYLFAVKNNQFIITQNITHMMFPKCCPPESFYNKRTKSCSNLNQTNTFDSRRLKRIGLPHCQVISDYRILSGMDQGLFDENFCFDETVDGHKVMRTCEDLSVCDKKRCLRKCCPDGQSFVNGSHCLDTFEHGLVLEDLSEFIHNITGKLFFYI